jgi:iron complex outermembrane recepter protein
MTPNRAKSVSRSLLIASLFLVFINAALAQAFSREVTFNIAAQPLSGAIIEFSKQAEVQVLAAGEQLNGVSSPGVRGRLRIEQALQVLLSGTGLSYKIAGQGTVTLVSSATSQRPPVSPSVKKDSSAADQSRPAASAESGHKGERIVVTGTNIRGAASSSSPLQIYARDDIDRAGSGSLQRFIQQLPQNFSNTFEDTHGQAAGGSALTNNVVYGTGVNLRGLGAESTLVLVNGRRISPGNVSGNFTDISLIPLIAIDRVEVVPDGASAIYGADAVGGVVNFILRRDLDGAETRAKYGGVTRGSAREIQIGQAIGQSWSSGSALLSYEYYDRSALQASERSFASSARQPLTLLPEQKRHGGFLSVQQDIGASANVFFDGFFGKRRVITDTAAAFFEPQHIVVRDIEEYSAAAGSHMDFGQSSLMEISAGTSRSDVPQEIISGGRQIADRTGRSTLDSVEVTSSGAPFSLPAGSMRYAIGGQHRREEYAFRNHLNPRQDLKLAREVNAGFVELRAPIIAGGTHDAGLVELSGAVRQERYSDFGQTNNPKVGLAWHPSNEAKVRASYGRSFRAPALFSLNPTPTSALVLPVNDPNAGGTTNTLFVFGGNPDLQSERAKTWSLGLDFESKALQGLKANVTYFDIRYTDRFVSPPSGFGSAGVLANERFLGPTIVQRNPSLALIQGHIASAGAAYANPLNVDLTTIRALVDARTQNLASVNTSGVDFGLSYRIRLPIGLVESGVDGTKIRNFKHQFTASSPIVDVLDTPYNPNNLRLRGRLVLQAQSVGLSMFVNYVDSYTDGRIANAPVGISSWTTIDVGATYQTRVGKGLTDQLTLSFGVNNIADRNPPFVANPDFRIDFDANNANALGRYVYLQISKRW